MMTRILLCLLGVATAAAAVQVEVWNHSGGDVHVINAGRHWVFTPGQWQVHGSAGSLSIAGGPFSNSFTLDSDAIEGVRASRWVVDVGVTGATLVRYRTPTEWGIYGFVFGLVLAGSGLLFAVGRARLVNRFE